MRRLDVGGHEVLIDSEDYELLSGFNWRPLVTDSEGLVYARAWRRSMHFYMHRLVIGAGPGEEVDHKNGNGLDNRKDNLRIATHSQNLGNVGKLRLGRPPTSPYKGVYWDKAKRAWTAVIARDERYPNGRHKSQFLGRFSDEVEAARAYDRAAIARWGEFARLNFEESIPS